MIFGIFGTFGIEIGTRKHFGRNFFRRKKSENFWPKIFLGPTFFEFCPKCFSLKKSMKIKNFEIPGKSRVFSKFGNFQFSLTFPKIFFSRFFLISKIIFRYFLRENFHIKKILFFSRKYFITPKFIQESENHT